MWFCAINYIRAIYGRSSGKEVASMRRIRLVLAIVLVAAVLVASAAPAMADKRPYKKHHDYWQPQYSKQCGWYWSWWWGWERWCWSPWFGWYKAW